MTTKKLITLPEQFVPYFHEFEGRSPEEWYASSDPSGKKTGSGGGTANLLAEAWRNEEKNLNFNDWLKKDKKIIIHSGGESRRLPAYSVTGKSSMPVPVFRWSKGQYIDQTLLDFQSSFYERIYESAPEDYICMIGSGDVLFISPDRFNNLPKADLLCLGVWVDDETASRHGVFFSKKTEPESLSFGIQKPSRQELEELSRQYYYQMDSGIWLLTAKACRILMKKSGWDEDKSAFTAGVAGFYDLYGSMGMAFGKEARVKDNDINPLDVKIYPIEEGEFYHFGSNRDLVGSNEALQNRITDQRRIWHHEKRRHPGIFQQNSIVDIKFSDEHENIWVENSHVSQGWKISKNHIITGIPKNEWQVNLPEGMCIDIIPVKEGGYCLRTYGYLDNFRGSIEDNVQWMNKALNEWLDERDLSPQDLEISKDEDIYNLPLFPVLGSVETAGKMISWLCGSEDRSQNDAARDNYLKAKKLSARNIASETDFQAINDQKREYKKHVLVKLAANREKSIFYHLDLKKAACDFTNLSLDLPGEVRKDEPVIRLISDRMFRSLATNGNDSGKYEKEAFGILRESIVDTVRDFELNPRRDILDDQILWGRSPVRLDLAGGWTDTPPFCIINGGTVVNMSVELNGQPPLQVFARPLEEYKIVLRSIDLGLKEEIYQFEGLDSCRDVTTPFSIPKAALLLAGFGNEFSGKKYPSLEKQLKEFGCGIELSLLAAVPKGSGLGTSSNLAATVLGVLNEFGALGWDKHELCNRTLILEQILTAGGGWQDQYGGIFPGIKMLESATGIVQKPSIKWLPDKLFEADEYKPLSLLYYTGVTRVAKDILGEIVKGMFLNSSEHLQILDEMRYHADETRELIQRNDYEGLAEKVKRSWILNQRLDSGTNPPEIQKIVSRIDDYLLGYKLLGAGGGGYMLMLARDEEAARRVKQLLREDPPNRKARFVDFGVSEEGFRVSRS